MLTDVQKKSAKAIVSIFESSKVDGGNYGTIANVKGDLGGLSYGKHQASINSGNLYGLIAAYVAAKGKYATQLNPYLKRMKDKDATLGEDTALKAVLKNAGTDPVMQRVQEDYFETQFWKPAVKRATDMGITTALGVAVVYDSYIQGSFDRIKDKCPLFTDEKSWVVAYLNERKKWMEGHSNTYLKGTTYRPEAFLKLIAQNNWDLKLPFVVKGLNVTEQALGIVDESKLPAVPPLPKAST